MSHIRCRWGTFCFHKADSANEQTFNPVFYSIELMVSVHLISVVLPARI